MSYKQLNRIHDEHLLVDDQLDQVLYEDHWIISWKYFPLNNLLKFVKQDFKNFTQTTSAAYEWLNHLHDEHLKVLVQTVPLLHDDDLLEHVSHFIEISYKS